MTEASFRSMQEEDLPGVLDLYNHYIVTSRHGWGMELWVNSEFWCGVTNTGYNYMGKPGYMTIVGTQNNTQVSVDFSAYTHGGDVPQRNPGQTGNYTLNRGEALQFVTRMPANGTPCPGTETGEEWIVGSFGGVWGVVFMG